MRQKQKTLKRKVTLLPNYKEYLNLNETRQGFCDYAVTSIDEALKKNDTIAKLFVIDNSHEFLLDKSQWVDTLNSVIKVYQQQEQYEKCADCIELLNRL
jgi:hypothetical protein